MITENMRQCGIVAERVQLMLRNGENEKALDLMAQNYGPVARQIFEKVMKYSNLSQDELVRVFGKISDILENKADKLEKHIRLKDIKEKKQAKEMQEQQKAEIAALQAAADERKAKFEAHIKAIEDMKKEIALKKKKLEKELSLERDEKKRCIIREKIRKLERRRKELEAKRQALKDARRGKTPQGRSAYDAEENTTRPQKTERKISENIIKSNRLSSSGCVR